MAHLVRTQPDSVWVTEYHVKGSDLADIDQKTFLAINGNDGGTWAPASQIVIGGAGMRALGPWAFSGSARVTGSITFGELSASDVFVFGFGHTGNSDPILTQFAEVYSGLGEEAYVTLNASLQVESIPTPVRQGVQARRPGARILIPLRVRNNATIDFVNVDFIVEESHANVPSILPRFRVFALDLDGNVLPLRAADGTTDADGWQSLPTPASVAAYNNSGLSQTFAYEPNQNHLADVSTRSYFLEITEEAGVNTWVTTPNIYLCAVTNISFGLFGNIPYLDGRS